MEIVPDAPDAIAPVLSAPPGTWRARGGLME